MAETTSYFQDIRSGVVIKFTSLWDMNEMLKNPEYAQVDEKIFKEYQKKQKEVLTGE